MGRKYALNVFFYSKIIFHNFDFFRQIADILVDMNTPILVMGAGRSATVLLDYINKLAEKEGFRFTVAEADEVLLRDRVKILPFANAVVFSAIDIPSLVNLIKGHSIVISLLPPPMHPLVGEACLECKANLITASYESPQMRAMAESIKREGLVFMNECGLDPGIDHMSAMEIIDTIKLKGGEISSFQSFCGGLVADENDDNPFRYKISWNPRNVVLAGKGGSKYLQNGSSVFVPYHRLFSSVESIEIANWGQFEAYPNRDSVPYAKLYGIPNVKDLKRGTLRKKGFCTRWDVFVQLGMTDDENQLSFPPTATYIDYICVFLPDYQLYGKNALLSFIGNETIVDDIVSMGFLPQNPTNLKRFKGTPADFLLDLIVTAWPLKTIDKDLVVMTHIFKYKVKDSHFQTISSLCLTGENTSQTAMAKTVGLPLGIFAKLLLHNEIPQKGLLLPLDYKIYNPTLKELAVYGVQFQSKTMPTNIVGAN